MPTDNVFTRKIGPLPGWAWVLAGVAGVAAYQRIAARRSATSSPSQVASGPQGAIATPYGVNYAPQQPYAGGGQSGGNNDNAMLESFLSILAAQGASSPSPGNAGGVTTSPGNTGNPGLQPDPNKVPPSFQFDPQRLPKVDSGAFPVAGASGASYDVLGRFTGAGGQFTGLNVAGGAPVYAQQPGQTAWMQDFNAKTLPVGTVLATPSTFAPYIVPGTVTETLG